MLSKMRIEIPAFRVVVRIKWDGVYKTHSLESNISLVVKIFMFTISYLSSAGLCVEEQEQGPLLSSCGREVLLSRKAKTSCYCKKLFFSLK